MKKITLLLITINLFSFSIFSQEIESDSTKVVIEQEQVITDNEPVESEILEEDSYVEEDANENVNGYSNKNFNSWAITFGVGNIYTSGDLTSFGYEKSSFDIGFNLGVTKMFNSTLGIDLHGVYGTSHTYPDKYLLNITETNGETTTPYFTGNVGLVINLSNLILSGNNYQRKWNFSVIPGIGVTMHKAYFKHNTDSNLDEDWANNGSKTDQYTRLFNVPLGLSVKYRLNKHFDIELRETITYYSEDNFDGRVYANTSDWGYYTGISLVWKLGKHERSREWADPLDESLNRVNEIDDKMNGLTSDMDHDGVSDLFDIDNSTPDSVRVSGDGKALDIDDDGIPDYDDAQPFSDRLVRVDDYGRELDSDNDGIGNSKDKEPNTAIGAFVNWEGRTIGNSSGISDALIPSIYFKHNSSWVDEDLRRQISVLARILKENPEIKLVAIGYADASGSEKYNVIMGQKRADRVKNELVDVYGISSDRMETTSAGESNPLATKKGYEEINRRVDFRIKK